jgi:hypothetical protein
MLPYQDAAANAYLLIAGGDSGSILRLAIADKKLVTVATGLRQPTSMAFDPVTGNLLVSEAGANQITLIQRSQFDPTVPRGTADPVWGPPYATGSGRASITVASPRGVAYDTCTGATYVTANDGTLREFLGTRERTVVSGLDRPGQILVLHREGVSSCREGVTLLVCEAAQLTQVDPISGERLAFLSGTQNALDVIFLPKGNPFTPDGEELVGVAESPAGAAAGRIAQVTVGGVYKETVPQPPTLVDVGGTSIPFRDPRADVFATARSAGGTAPDILSVDAYGVEGALVMSVTFAAPVAAASANLPASITGFIDFDTIPGTGGASHADAYNAFGQTTGLGVDAYVDLSTGVLHRDGGADVPVTMNFLDTTLTLTVPGVLTGATQSRIALVVGNRLETTDVAPNAGFINMSVDPSGNRTVQFDRSASSGLESQGSAPIEVRLSSAATQTVTVQYAASGGSAASGVDYRLAPGSLTFLAGEVSKTIPLAIVDNTAAGPNKTVRIALSGPTGAALGQRSAHTYTIVDDDAAPTVQFTSDAASGANTASTVSIPVSLSSASSQTVTVRYGVSGGTAVSGTDFTLAAGTLTFAPGEIAKRIPLTVLDTGPTGARKTVVIALSAPANATLGAPSTHTYTIIGRKPDPIVVQFETSASSGLASAASVEIPVALSAQSLGLVTVAPELTPGSAGTAVHGVDFTWSPAGLSFRPGETRARITFTVLNNPNATNNRTVIFTLRNPINATLGTRTTHTYTILKSTSTQPSVSFKTSASTLPWISILAPIDLELSSPASSEVIVGFKVSGTAKEGTFAIAGPGLVLFPPGETAGAIVVLMLPIFDETPPASATVVVELMAPQNATLGAITTHTLTITYPKEEAPR